MKHLKTYIFTPTILFLFASCLLHVASVPVADAKIVYCVDGDIFVMDDNATNKRRLTNNPLWEGGPRWSPDGTQIAFVREMDKKKDDSDELFIMNADGTNIQQLTHSDGYDSNPSWSPDGKKIVFNSTRSEDRSFEIYVMELASRNVTQLTGIDGEGGGVSPDWSPDGTQIVYEHFGDDPDFIGLSPKTLYIMDATGENQRPLIPGPANKGEISMTFDPRWSTNGKRLLFDDCTHDDKGKQKCRLTVMRIGGAEKQIDEIYDRLGTNLFNAGADWMDNDRAIVFSMKIRDKPDANYDLYRYEFQTQSLRRLTRGTEDEEWPDWIEGTLSVSPQGKIKVTWGKVKQ